MLDMSGHEISLLPEAPNAPPMIGVQGGGGYSSDYSPMAGGARLGWYSAPLIIPVIADFNQSSSHLDLHNHRRKWLQILKGAKGPKAAKQEKKSPSSDSQITIAKVNVMNCETYLVAPLRGDMDAARDVLAWATEALKANKLVVFSGPLSSGNDRKIEAMVEVLMAQHHGRVVCVDCDTMESGCVDVISMYAEGENGLETSKQLVLGDLPIIRSSYSTSSRSIGCMEFEIVSVPADAKISDRKSQMLYDLEFVKPTAAFTREKQPKPQTIRGSHNWKSAPGWVTHITYRRRGQSGGAAEAIDTKPEVPKKKSEIIGFKGRSYEIPELTAERMKDIENGIYGPEIDKMLSDAEIAPSPKMVAAFLIAARNKTCSTETGAGLSADCAAYRYVVAQLYFTTLMKKYVEDGEIPGPEGSDAPAPAAPAAAQSVTEVKAPVTGSSTNTVNPVVTAAVSVTTAAPSVAAITATPAAAKPTEPVANPPATEPVANPPATEPVANPPSTIPALTVDFKNGVKEVLNSAAKIWLFGTEKPKEMQPETLFIQLPPNLSKSGVSRKHFAIIKDDAWYIVDTKSSVGTKVNGKPVATVEKDIITLDKTRATKLETDDEIQAGSIKATVQVALTDAEKATLQTRLASAKKVQGKSEVKVDAGAQRVAAASAAASSPTPAKK